MYSMLLMMAAGTGGDAPAFHGRFHSGCHGCYGAAPAGCCGGCCGGRYLPAYPGTGSGCCGGCTGCYGSGWGMAGVGSVTGSGAAAYSIYGMGYRSGPVVSFVPYGTTNLNPPDGSEPSVLKIELPKDAKLFVDGNEYPGTGTSRAFSTPALPRGQDFFYDLKAELTVNGKPVVEEKRVVVRAGGTVTESFTKLIAGEKVASR